MEVRKCGGVSLAVALALACALPSAAYADQLVRVYAQGEAIPQVLTIDDVGYSLASWNLGGGLEAATRSFERMARKTLPAADYGGDPEACFDAEMAIDEDGFSGSIPLVSAKAEVAESHPERSDFEEAVEFSFITKSELDALPDKRAATVDGAEVTLSKIDVEAERIPSDPGIEIYSGRAIYGIHEQRDVPDEYRLEASYAGEVSREASPATVVAVYEEMGNPGESRDAGPAPAEEPASESQARSVPSWTLAIPAAIAVAVSAALVIACVKLRAESRKGRTADGESSEASDDDPPEEDEGGEGEEHGEVEQ